MTSAGTPVFSTGCRQCGRLACHLAQVREKFPDYHALPVAPFGATRPRLLIVGLAPGMHGANRTGRPFTGDHAGILLYETLHRFGFASQPMAVSPDDGLRLKACRITNAVKCLPPENKPTPAEVKSCNAYLRQEIDALPQDAAILALGGVAHRAVLMARGLRQGDCRFIHGARHNLPEGRALYDSYHCSRYNTQTRRLTTEMFRRVFEVIASDLNTR